MNDIRSVRMYVSVIDDVYPKYSLIELRPLTESGFNEQVVHL